TFDSSGNQTGWKSADGLSLLTFTYSGNNIQTMQAVDGTTTTFNYSSGRVSTIVTGNNRTTSLAYDGSGNLTRVTNPDTGTRNFTYDGSHRVTSESFGVLANQWAYNTSGALATFTWGGASSPSVTTYKTALDQGLSAAARGPATVTEAGPD